MQAFVASSWASLLSFTISLSWSKYKKSGMCAIASKYPISFSVSCALSILVSTPALLTSLKTRYSCSSTGRKMKHTTATGSTSDNTKYHRLKYYLSSLFPNNLRLTGWSTSTNTVLMSLEIIKIVPKSSHTICFAWEISEWSNIRFGPTNTRKIM